MPLRRGPVYLDKFTLDLRGRPSANMGGDTSYLAPTMGGGE